MINIGLYDYIFNTFFKQSCFFIPIEMKTLDIRDFSAQPWNLISQRIEEWQAVGKTGLQKWYDENFQNNLVSGILERKKNIHW